MWFFVFSINFARTREGRPARRKLTERLVKSKKTLVTEPAAIFFVFQVNISCKTTSIILYFKYASFSVVTRKKRQNTNPHPDGNFFDDRFGLGILRDELFKHEQFSMRQLRNDVALLQLERPISASSKVNTVCMPSSGSRVPAGTRCYITGINSV